MQELEQALEEVKALHQEALGQPAPDLPSDAFVPFPPGVDPIRGALAEVAALKDLWERVKLAPCPATWMPLADVQATDAELVVRLEIPGVSREDVKVLVTRGECIVRGERKPPLPGAGVRPIALERAWGRFERRFLLPIGARTDEMKARISSGLLELRIPLDRRVDEREQEIEAD